MSNLYFIYIVHMSKSPHYVIYDFRKWKKLLELKTTVLFISRQFDGFCVTVKEWYIFHDWPTHTQDIGLKYSDSKCTEQSSLSYHSGLSGQPCALIAIWPMGSCLVPFLSLGYFFLESDCFAFINEVFLKWLPHFLSRVDRLHGLELPGL